MSPASNKEPNDDYQKLAKGKEEEMKGLIVIKTDKEFKDREKVLERAEKSRITIENLTSMGLL
jgi:hypothetical protein